MKAFTTYYLCIGVMLMMFVPHCCQAKEDPEVAVTFTKDRDALGMDEDGIEGRTSLNRTNCTNATTNSSEPCAAQSELMELLNDENMPNYNTNETNNNETPVEEEEETAEPSPKPSLRPTRSPTRKPTAKPTKAPTTPSPTAPPTEAPTDSPTLRPTAAQHCSLCPYGNPVGNPTKTFQDAQGRLATCEELEERIETCAFGSFNGTIDDINVQAYCECPGAYYPAVVGGLCTDIGYIAKPDVVLDGLSCLEWDDWTYASFNRDVRESLTEQQKKCCDKIQV